MNYPEYNNVTSRLRCQRLAATYAFAGNDVYEPADCVPVNFSVLSRKQIFMVAAGRLSNSIRLLKIAASGQYLP